MDNVVQEIKDTETEIKNPLEFWVAYKRDKDNHCHYLGDGRGNIRLFKTKETILEYLGTRLKPEEFKELTIHSIRGTIAIPEIPKEANNILVPISSLSSTTVPSAMELLRNIENGKAAKRRIRKR